MNKGISKWPSKVLNLLVVLSMVIALCAVLATPVAAQEWSESCDPSPVYNGCQLEVAVNTYIKDVDDDFIPLPTTMIDDDGNATTPDVAFPAVTPGVCFYVNAVVVNTGNATAIAPINATITLPTGVMFDVYEDGYNGSTSTKQWLGNLTYAAPDGLIADFWWKVCCKEANGLNTIMVNATATPECVQECPAVGTVTVYQGETGPNKCLDIEIVEFPGMGNKTGLFLDDQGQPVKYHMTVPGTINACTNFGVKAEITNTCTYPLNNVYGNISWTGPASIVGGDPLGWNIGTLLPGQTKAVGWTLHCDDPGDVEVTVFSENNTGIQNLIDNPRTVHQSTPGGLSVVITQPTCTTDSCDPTCEIKQPYAVGACSSESNFTAKATVTNTGDTSVINIYAVATATPASGWVSITSPIVGPFTLGPGASQEATYAMRCIGVGDGNITVSASGTESPSGLPVIATPDVVTIAQKSAIAQLTPDPIYAPPDEVNKCQEFDVTFRYTNYTATGWNVDGTHGNVTACINWVGDAELDGTVYYRRIVGGLAESWQILNATPGNVTGIDCENLITVVCPCCSVDVRWHFRCTDANDVCEPVNEVSFWSTLTVDQITPAIYHAEDTSETVCVDQVWKAHLTGDVFFFIQEEDTAIMLLQDAVVPGTDFHVVIPVINTGDADAQNVQVYFTISDDPTGDCTESYTFVSSSGDGVVAFNPQTGVGTASFNVIPGHSAVKAILLLHCNCEGHVSLYIPDLVTAWGDVKGIRGFDENTGEAIPQDNISTPPCPRVLEQIPFTVVIENPYSCQTFNQGDTFPVKAKISNGSIMDLLDVSATISWTPGDPIELVETQTMTKYVGNITAGGYDEMTWMLRCTGEGDVHLWVSATLPSPLLTAISDDNLQVAGNQPVIVHQEAPPGACLSVTILSPGADTWIATGQEFAVTAKIYNSGPDAAVNVTASIGDCPGSMHYVTLADGQDWDIDLGTLNAGYFKVATWTLWGGSDHDYAMVNCTPVNDTICVNATTDTQPASCNPEPSDEVEITVYPAAFLVAEIDPPIDPTTILTCSEFTVNYKVTNYGVADAWSASVTLGVNPDGSVRIAEGQGGYTQYLGTIPGWSWGAPFNSVSGSFKLHCKQACESTLTITPAGFDECGWDMQGAGEVYTGLSPASLAGREIPGKFIYPDSETVKQVTTLPITGDMTEYDINLVSGWNLVSLPLIPNSTAIGTVLADVDENVDIVWMYDASIADPALRWKSWVPGESSDLTTMTAQYGYWINMDAADTMTVYGVELKPAPNTPPAYPVVTGWNLIGFKSTTARTAGDYLAAIAGDWTRMYAYGNAKYSAVSSDSMMYPGQGYWIAVTAAGTIYP